MRKAQPCYVRLVASPIRFASLLSLVMPSRCLEFPPHSSPRRLVHSRIIRGPRPPHSRCSKISSVSIHDYASIPRCSSGWPRRRFAQMPPIAYPCDSKSSENYKSDQIDHHLLRAISTTCLLYLSEALARRFFLDR